MEKVKQFFTGILTKIKAVGYRNAAQNFTARFAAEKKFRVVTAAAGIFFISSIAGIYAWSMFGSISVSKELYTEVPVVDNSVLRVIQSSPSGTLEGKERRKEVTVVFNHPMVPLAALEETTAGIFTVTPAIQGRFRWYGSRVCAFIPDKGWNYGGTYTVTVKKGTAAMNGMSLKEEHKFSFTFDIPTMEANIWTNPYRDPTIDYDQSFTISFSYPVSLNDFRKKFTLTNRGKNIPYKVDYSTGYESYDDEGSSGADRKVNRKYLSLTPSGRFAFDSPVELKVLSGLRSEGADAELKNEKVYNFSTHGDLTVEFVNESQYFDNLWDARIIFSNEVDFKTIRNSISFKPKAALRESSSGSSKNIAMSMYSLTPGKTYSIKVNPLTDIHGNKLINSETFTFTAPDVRPSYNLEDEYKNVIESAHTMTLPIEVNNISQLKVRHGTFSIKDVGEAVESGDSISTSILNSISLSSAAVWDTGLKNNQWGRIPLQIKKYIKSGTTGWLGFELSGDVIDYQGRLVNSKSHQIVQATDLGLTVKESFAESFVWVHSLSKGVPVKGAVVAFYTGTKKISETKTDDLGFCKISNPSGELLGPSLYMVSAADGDRAFTASKMHNLPMYYICNTFDEDSYKSEFLGQILFDRKLYRPGDTINFKGVLSFKEKGRLAPVGKESLSVTIADSRGQEVYSKSITSTAQGGIWGSWDIPKDVPLGHFQVRIDNGYGGYINDTFQVEEFRPVTFKVDLSGLDDTSAGRAMKLTIDGQYLFGAPMNDAPVTYSVYRAKSRVYFPHYSSFTFGDGNIWSDDEIDWSDAGYFTGGSGVLVQGGKYTFTLTPSPMKADENLSEPETVLKLSDTYEIKVEAKVKDVDDKSVTKSAYAKVFPGNAMFGINVKQRYQSASNRFSFDLVAVGNDGTSAGERPSVIHVIKYEYKSILSKGTGGTLQPRNTLIKKVISRQEMSLSSQPKEFSVQVDEPGSYTILVQEQGGMSYSRDSFYAWGGGGQWWGMNDDDSITLVPDKKEYNPGETARVLIQSPFENCTAIVTLERESVIWQKQIEITGSGTPVDVPMKEEYLPNVYMSVMLIRPRVPVPGSLSDAEKRAFIDNDLGAPKFKAGVVKLSVSNRSKRLPFKLTTDRSDYSPGDTVTVTIETAPGAEIALTAADRGVLDLINYHYSDPVNKFFQNWKLAVRILDNRRFIIKQLRSTQKGDSPGGQGKGDDLEGVGGFDQDSEDGTRKDFRYTAHWNPAIIAGKDGKAVFSFKLPHNLTTFRLMTLAALNGKFARAENEIRARKAVVIQQNLPRFMRPGDTLTAGAVIINQTGISGNFIVTLNSDMFAEKSRRATVMIKNGEAKEVTFPVTIDAARYASLRKNADAAFTQGKVSEPIEVKGTISVTPENIQSFVVAGNSEKDIKDRMEFKFPVREQPPEEAFTIAGFTENKEKEFMIIPDAASYIPSMGSFNVTLSSTVLTGLEKGFTFFKLNPYMCLEQRASAYLLTITAGDLLKNFGYSPPSDSDYDFSKIEKSFIGELKDFQNSDGGFSAWKGSSFRESSDPYLTAYVSYVLENGKRKGKSIDESAYSNASRYLKNYFKKPPKDNYSYVLDTFAMINMTLALQDSYNSSIGNFLLDKKKELSLTALAYAGIALALDKNVNDYKTNSEISAIHQRIVNSMEITTRKVSFKETSFGSPRSYASGGAAASAILRFLMKVDGANPLIPGIVQYIMADTGVWGSSHGTGTAALALHDYHEIYEKKGGLTSGFSGNVLLNSKEIFSASLSRKELTVPEFNMPLYKLTDFGKPGAALPLEFASSGKNRMYYTSSLIYYPALKEVKARDEGIEVHREIIDLSLAPGVPSAAGVNRGSLKRGDVYQCKVRLVVSKPSFNVLITDPLPSNVEVVNTAFQTEAGSLAALATGGEKQYDYWWMGAKPIVEYRDDRVIITQDYMEPGMHEFTYLIRPIVKGRSASPAAVSKLMYEPEIFGRTAGGSLSVH